MSDIDEAQKAALKRIQEAGDIVTDKWFVVGAKTDVEHQQTPAERLADLKKKYPWLNTEEEGA